MIPEKLADDLYFMWNPFVSTEHHGDKIHDLVVRSITRIGQAYAKG